MPIHCGAGVGSLGSSKEEKESKILMPRSVTNFLRLEYLLMVSTAAERRLTHSLCSAES